jgi:hypothetical protein
MRRELAKKRYVPNGTRITQPYPVEQLATLSIDN